MALDHLLTHLTHRIDNQMAKRFNREARKYSINAQAWRVLPVVPPGPVRGQAADTFAALGSTDLIYCCGGGVAAHPGGVAAGVASLRQAWEAAVAGGALDDHARGHPELAQALAAFGH